MSKSHLFHGTTYKNFLAWRDDDFFYKPSRLIWNDSHDGEHYFYDLDKMIEANCRDNADEGRDDCIRGAFQSAQITAAAQNYDSSDLVVAEFVISANYVEDDFSSPNMHHESSVVSADYMEHAELVNLYVASHGYAAGIRYFYLLGIYNNGHFNKDNLSKFDIMMLDMLSNAKIEIPWDDIWVDDWQVTNPINL